MIPNLSNSPDKLFEEMSRITKAHAYDIVAKQRDELVEENKLLLRRIKYLEDLIKEYTEKMLKNIDGSVNKSN